MRILLLGAAGQLGIALRGTLGALGEVVAVARTAAPASGIAHSLDMADTVAVEQRVEASGADVVVNAAAYTAVDRAESERDLCFRVNAEAPGAMARACHRTGARLVHFSTDYVFDGTASEPYAESATTAPQGIYGASKEAGEKAIRTAECDALVIRTAWVYALHGQNFLTTMLRLGAEREELRVVADQAGSPTPAWLIARSAADMIRARVGGGTYHVVSRGCTTWHGFAQAIMDEAWTRGMVARKPAVTAITSAEYPTPARRPSYSVLDPSRVESELGLAMPHWRDALSATFDRERPAGNPA